MAQVRILRTEEAR
jgi:hypothetical protein